MDKENDPDEAMNTKVEEDNATSTPSTSEAVKNKAYKTTLCTFYLEGPCKNGDKCNYAHGTSELRSGSSTVKDAEVKTKTKLCEKFLQFGTCQFGASCNFAHGVRELQQAIQSNANAASNNANFKTALCKAYMNGLYCQFADKCQYAHGRHELRPKAQDASSTPSTSSSSKAKAKAEYKTKLCQNFEKDGECEFNEMCSFAHGTAELRSGNNEAKKAPKQQANNANFKTQICKYSAMASNCPFSASCSFAHSPAELRPKMGQGAGMNPMMYPAPPCPRPAPPPPPPGALSKVKTQLCKNYTQGKMCPFGEGCQFAHGQHELRPSMAGPSMSSTGYSSFAPSPSSDSFMAPNGKYRTTMCTSMSKSGVCQRGFQCNYAHSPTQLMMARQADPKYKTAICENWKKSGCCERGDSCHFAHGIAEQRFNNHPGASSFSTDEFTSDPTPTTFFGGGYDYYSNNSKPSPVNKKAKFKASMYKTSMCRSISTTGRCDKGDDCAFAHNTQELRRPEDNVSGANKRKSDKCQNYALFGNCPDGDGCELAHEDDDLTINKRQRL